MRASSRTESKISDDLKDHHLNSILGDSKVFHVDADYEGQSRKQSLHKYTPLKSHRRELLLDRPISAIIQQEESSHERTILSEKSESHYKV